MMDIDKWEMEAKTRLNKDKILSGPGPVKDNERILALIDLVRSQRELIEKKDEFLQLAKEQYQSNGRCDSLDVDEICIEALALSNAVKSDEVVTLSDEKAEVGT